MVSFSLSLTWGDRHFIRYADSPHHRATMQRPWRSLRSPSALVIITVQVRSGLKRVVFIESK